MTVYTRSPFGSITLLDPANAWALSKPLATLQPIEWTWSFSEASVPSIVSSMRIPPPSAALWAWLDPAVRPLLLIQEGVARQPTPEPNTAIFAGQRVIRRVRNEDNSVTLTSVFWEQDLIDYSPPAVDRSNWAKQADISAIISNVLDKVYGPGKWQQAVQTASDGQQLTGSFLTYQAATNLVANPSFQYGTAGWTGTRATVSTQNWAGGLGPDMGTNTMRLIGAGGTNTDTFASTPVNLQPGTTYTMSGWVLNGSPMSNAHGRARSLCIVATVNGTAFVLAQSNQGANTANGITRVSTTFTTPAMMDPTGAALRAYNGTAATNVVLWDGIMIVEGDGMDTDGTLIPFFDGDTVDGTGRGAGYNYDWQGDPGNSSSTRTPVLDRDPDALTWKPGQSAWDFLSPILESVGGRLQAWSAAPPFAYRWITSRFTPAGIVGRYVEGANLYSVTQDVDLSATFSDGTPMFADAVVIRYSWTDSQGVQHEEFDAYPTSGYTQPWYQELDSPFPGPGRAQGLYLRLRARASMLTLVVPYNPGLYPSRQVSVTASQLGGTLLGIIDTVDHDPFAGTTTIRTKNTISYPTNAWVTKTTPWSALAGSWATQ